MDVVESNVPLLISHESLHKMKGSIDFGESSLTLGTCQKIKLIQTPSGHLMISGRETSERTVLGIQSKIENVFAMEIRLPVESLDLAELKRIHLQLWHCSENTSKTVLKSAQMHGDPALIQKLFTDCKCQVAAQRITSPTVACWLSKYNGEIIALEIIFHSMIAGGEKVSKEFPALFTIDSLSRFINCSLLISRTAEHCGQTFLNDCVRTIGKPRRIITDAGGPTLTGAFWRELSDTYGRQMIQGPKFTPQQNGLAERAVRSFKIAVRNIYYSMENPCPCQEILTQAVIAKNHVPRTATGIPPALAMTGRCDILAGYSHTAFNRDPEVADSVMKVNNNMRNIMNARNAIIHADARYAVRTMINRKAPDRFLNHFYVGASVQIAWGNVWSGTYRVLAVLDSNLVLGRAGRVSKWPKCKSRIIHDDSIRRFDTATIPNHDNEIVEKDNNDLAESSGLNDLVNPELDLCELPSEPLPQIEDEDIEVQDDVLICEMFRPKDTYIHIPPGNFVGSVTQVICPEHHTPEKWTIQDCGSLFYSMNSGFPIPNTFLTSNKVDSVWFNHPKRKGKDETRWLDDDIVDSFGPSRLPPRIVFKLPGARKAVEKEITDLLTPHGLEPPAMVVVALNDSRFK